MLENILGNPKLAPVDNTRPVYGKAIREMAGKEIGDKLVAQLNLYGAFKKVPKEVRHNIMFSDMNMYWDQKTKSFTDKRGRVIYGTPDVLMDLTKAIEVDPNNSLAYSTRGYYKYRNKNYDGAILDLSIAIELNPKNLTALEYRGLAYRDNGTPFEADMSDWDLTDAIKDFTKLIEIDPNNSEWYFNRAVCYNLSYGSGYKSLTLKDLNMAITFYEGPSDQTLHKSKSGHFVVCAGD